MKCPSHGKPVTATVCGHLVRNNGAPLGFIENNSDSDNLQGWCYACEYLYLQEKEKTDAFMKFCNFAVVCNDCYKMIKQAYKI